MSEENIEVSGDDLNEQGGVIGNGNAARLAKLEAIGAKSEHERAEDLMEFDGEHATAPFVPTAIPGEEDIEDTAGQEAARTEAARQEAEREASTQASARIVRKINGVDVEITDEMIAKAQKIAAADVYLEEAARMRNELATKAKPSAQDVSQQQAVDDDLALREGVRAIQMGTEEEAAAALRKLIARPAAPVIDKATIAKEVDEQLAFKQAYQQFAVEYKDVLADPVLLKLARDRDDELVRKGDKRSYYERFKDTGEAIRKWEVERAAKHGTVQTQQTKQERKEAATQAPKAAGGRHSTQPVEEKEESVSDVIAAMREKRNAVPNWMKQ
jgi:hypothetical protein